MSQSKSLARLAQCIQDMDSQSQDGFGRIRDLAALALLAMEVPRAYQDMDAIAGVFATIEQIADTSQNRINAEAEDVGGYQFKDSARAARSAALRCSLLKRQSHALEAGKAVSHG